MIVIHHPTNNALLGAPEGWNEERDGKCHALPATIYTNCIVSWWQPSPEELQQIMSGAPIRLIVAGNSMPPVSLDVDEKA